MSFDQNSSFLWGKFILTGDTMVGFVIFCLLRKSKTIVRNRRTVSKSLHLWQKLRLSQWLQHWQRLQLFGLIWSYLMFFDPIWPNLIQVDRSFLLWITRNFRSRIHFHILHQSNYLDQSWSKNIYRVQRRFFNPGSNCCCIGINSASGI